MATPETTVFESANGVSTLAAIGDTIRMPWSSTTEGDDRVVRPALAVLFRIALGPAADSYVPRFLEYERSGRSIPGWHWPAFLAQAVWAFYRKLWVPAVVAALLPLVGLAGFAFAAPWIPDGIAWYAAAVLLVWALPGALFATFANSLLYRRVKRIVADAESQTGTAHEVASAVAKSRPTSLVAAAVLGGAAFATMLAVVSVAFRTLDEERAVRTDIEAALAAMQPLQREVEEEFARTQTMPRPDAEALRALAGAAAIDDVSVSEASGRLRLVFGAVRPELAGKMILLVPAQDAGQRIDWACIPVGIDPRHVPARCRGR